MPRTISIVPLCEMVEGQEADSFVLLAAKTDGTTRDGKPFQRVTFRDAGREVSFPIWSDSGHADACRDHWQAGQYYKVRAVYTETKYGPQLDIRKIRPVAPEDRVDGFDEAQERKLAARVPMRRHGQPADVAAAVRFFATCPDYITGQVLFVDGGATAV